MSERLSPDRLEELGGYLAAGVDPPARPREAT